jgi:hypothetical protein
MFMFKIIRWFRVISAIAVPVRSVGSVNYVLVADC